MTTATKRILCHVQHNVHEYFVHSTNEVILEIGLTIAQKYVCTINSEQNEKKNLRYTQR